MISFATRIKLTLPPWWGSLHPNLDSVASGIGAGHDQVFRQQLSVVSLLRIKSMTGDLLDIAAYDFYGNSLGRGLNEQDDLFRARIQSNLFKIVGVRPAFVSQVTLLTGASPVVIDPRQPADTGVLGGINVVPTLFYNSKRQDCYTNLNMGFQWFVQTTANVQQLSSTAIYAAISSYMPAGTVAWTYLGA